MKKEYIIYKLSEDMKNATRIENELFKKFDVKRGLRNEDGTGVLVGLTKIGNVVGYERIPGGGLKPIPGKLFYRGYDLEDLAHSIIKEKRFGFEEVAYLLLSGHLPDKEELASFCELINDNTPLEQKTKMNIIELEGNNIMNILARSVLEMYRFDPQADDTSRDNLMRQSIDLISKFPTIIAYAYNMLRHATYGRSLHIRHPREKLSIAENFLYMLKKDYTELDARTLDLLLVLQAEHGGGNNSTFTVRVVSSSRTDTYSATAAVSEAQARINLAFAQYLLNHGECKDIAALLMTPLGDEKGDGSLYIGDDDAHFEDKTAGKVGGWIFWVDESKKLETVNEDTRVGLLEDPDGNKIDMSETGLYLRIPQCNSSNKDEK